MQIKLYRYAIMYIAKDIETLKHIETMILMQQQK